MDIMIDILSKYNFAELQYGVVDCNTIFLEIFEPEMFAVIHKRYTTELFGYSNLPDFLNDKYTQVPLNYAAYGDVFMQGKHTAICLGDKTFTLVGERFGITSTTNIINRSDMKCYRKEK